MPNNTIRALMVLGPILALLAGCKQLDEVGRAPEFTPVEGTYQYDAMYSAVPPANTDITGMADESSLWMAGSASLLGDRRAQRRGDILTVVVEIDDQAQISNTTDRNRSGAETLGLPSLFGLPQIIDPLLPAGASMGSAVSTNSTSTFSGNGSVARNEKLTLRVAATVVEELPNGVLRIEGQQEVRVNFELRELIVSGFIRPADISRQNEITYDKIAGARISYGGHGQISSAQQPRYGQQVADAILPF